MMALRREFVIAALVLWVGAFVSNAEAVRSSTNYEVSLKSNALAGKMETSISLEEFEARSSPPLRVMTERPIIGIVTLPVSLPEEMVFGAQTFATSYVRFLQAGGGRVAPIFYDSTDEELESILGKVNGVLWTGSMVSFNPSDDEPEGYKYRRTTERILRYAIRENQKGNYYPLWGTCLGFERLMELLLQPGDNGKISGPVPVLEEVDAADFPINLDLTSYALRSRLFRNLSRELLSEMSDPDSDIVYHNHELGVTPETFYRDSWVQSAFRILSTNKDRNGKEFVSSIECTDMPLYGSQWHPEKCAWEWKETLHPSHSAQAIKLSNYVGRFFVHECKFNGNSFLDEDDENAALIHNWFSYPTGNWTMFSEVYFFWSPHPNERPATDPVARLVHPQSPLFLKFLKSIL